MKNSLDNPEKMKQNTNLENLNGLNKISNENKISPNNIEDKQEMRQ